METVERILSQMSNISTPQRKFLVLLFSTIMMLRGRMNFRNLSRYSRMHEKSFSRNFRKSFDFTMFNNVLIADTIPVNNKRIAAIDASYAPKSGKHSYGIDYFRSGVANKSRKGQEISSPALIDPDCNTAYNLSVEQTPSGSEIGTGESNRIDFYLQQVKRNQSYLTELGVTHIATDGFYSKTRFMNGICKLGFHQIGRLRNDADLRHLYRGGRKTAGRPKRYDGKVKFDDLSRWIFVTEIEPGVLLYTADLNSPRFKRDLRVVYVLDTRNPKKQRYALFFSTDLELSALCIFNWYKARFQIEFIFRDAKQFTGLTDCQARRKEAPNFHFNASLSALNLLKSKIENFREIPRPVRSLPGKHAISINTCSIDLFHT